MSKVSKRHRDRRLLKVCLLTPQARQPVRGSKLAAGLDLHCVETTCLAPHSTARLALDLAISVPRGTYGRIAARSSAALAGVDVVGGVVDADYTGPVFVIARNTTPRPITVEPDRPIAQLILERLSTADVALVEKLSPRPPRHPLPVDPIVDEDDAALLAGEPATDPEFVIDE